MMDSDPFRTQRDVGLAVVTELSAAGFADAEEIGRGGFGIVCRCRQVALDRTVAVKVLTAETDEDRERFLREQRATHRAPRPDHTSRHLRRRRGIGKHRRRHGRRAANRRPH